MPLTQIDENSALVVIDLQRNIVGMLGDAARPTVTNAAALAADFRAAGRPVVLVNVATRPPGRTDAGTSTAEFAAADIVIDAALGSDAADIRITKRAWGAFTNTDLDARLRELGVTQIVMTGISTSIGVESTARSAYELGYHVVLVEDAMTDSLPAAHDFSVATIFPKLGEVTTTADIGAKLHG
ncbi:isochorismatase family protein [Gordonia liuliyuniae]|uniref:Isochorismatase family protein n=1 Tax=Gordonia liuliyuniae TaxID=2911517 RepID=A0ABS9IXB6_9ACTN|nr:isochorismatase family protein [Gordonia liuliyuniae]MCF8590199.1 isochorismatase family protein [Gordonia liuliyuniae]